MKTVEVSDFTLKNAAKGEKRLTFRDKTEIARVLSGIGVDAIELPEIKNSKEDAVINRTISSVVNCTVAIPVGFSEDSLNEAFSSISSAEKPRLQVVVPVSTVGMEYICHMKAPKMLEKVVELCKAAREKCTDVELVATDATRAEMDFLKQLCKTAAENGAGIVTISDDAGIFMPDEFANIIKEIKSACSAKVYCSTSNSINMAAANAVAAVMAGADGVKTTAMGDITLLAGQFADIVRAKGHDMGIECRLNISGIHRDISSLKVTATSEVVDMAVNETGVTISLNAESTLTEVCEAVRALGYELTDEDSGRVYEEFGRVCSRKDIIGTKELDAIVASAAMQVPSTYHLESYVINSGNVITATANVALVKDGEKFSGISTGDGPINAAFLAIEQIVGFHYELDDFQIQAVTEGHEAVGSAIVKLRHNGVLYSGNGISTDIIGASIRAYLNALNKIVYSGE